MIRLVVNVLAYQLHGDLGIHVNRAKQTLVLDGVLLSERGEYTFMTRYFSIKRGSATFINSTELNPTLQATGEYLVRQPNREAMRGRETKRSGSRQRRTRIYSSSARM